MGYTLAKGFDNIVFTGRLSDGDINSYLLACDIFTFPSITRNEAYGIALAEALYFGKPAVTFTVKGSGINWVSINGETGIEVPNGDSKAYAEAMKSLRNDKELYAKLAEGAYKRAHQICSIEAFTASAQNIYADLLKR